MSERKTEITIEGEGLNVEAVPTARANTAEKVEELLSAIERVDSSKDRFIIIRSSRKKD